MSTGEVIVLVSMVLEVERLGEPFTVTVTTLCEGTRLVSTVDGPGAGADPPGPYPPEPAPVEPL